MMPRLLVAVIPQLLVVIGVLASLAWGADTPLPTERPKLRYNRDIRPILAENCFACHGVDSAARKANLRLDDREAAWDRGAIEPGKPDDSELVARIFLDADDDRRMPPKASHKTLKPEQKELLRRWIAEGAEYEPHWAFIPPAVPPVPLSADPTRRQWARNTIDHFVMAELERRGLQPAPEADRRTLARRLALDLTGLPPDPDDVDRFVQDTSPDWYERYVDRLMASPHWGEHRARYWLDAARYADTHGIHFDNYREMWSYRDWVIEAFNANQPFDRFAIEQLAGDLLPSPTLDQRIATGFNRCNITTNEGGLIDEEYLVLYTRDRTETASQVFLGLTAGCAVCHDHKFDPLSQKEFYQLAAFFNHTTQGARDGNIPDTPPVVIVPRREDRPRWDQLAKLLAESQKNIAARRSNARPEFERWLPTAAPAAAYALLPSLGQRLHLPLDDRHGTDFIAWLDDEPIALDLPDGYAWTTDEQIGSALKLKLGKSLELPSVGDFAAHQPYSVSLHCKSTKRGQTGAILARMDEANQHRGWDLWIEGDRLAAHVIHRWSSRALKVATQQPIPINQWLQVTVTYDGSARPEGLKIFLDGVLQPTTVQVNTLQPEDDIRTSVPFKLGQRHASARLANMLLADVRLYDRALTDAEVRHLAKAPQAAAILRKPAEARTADENNAVYEWWLTTLDEPFARLSTEHAQLLEEQATLRRRGTVAHVSEEKPGMPMAYVLKRGEYDQRQEAVHAATPAVLPPFPDHFPRNRLGFAQWLFLPDHPLTARVAVNRFWQELFGQGLVRTPGDFGISGELPSHPELLDWLARDFQQDWNVKRFFRLLVTSATYRQAAAATPEKLERDPGNVWLSRGPRFRLDAEMIRDQALAASGLLVRTIGGPSVKPYQPEGVWEAVAMIGSDTREYKQDRGSKLYRRSLYTFWKRAAPPASMEVLNAPNRETCTVRRDRTNTPLQALLTLNDVQFVEAARVLAERAMKSHAASTVAQLTTQHQVEQNAHGPAKASTSEDPQVAAQRQESTEDARRINHMALRLLARTMNERELAILSESLARLRQHYRNDPDAARKLINFGEYKSDPALDPIELAALTMVANQLLNLDEALNK